MRLRPHHLLCTQGYGGKGYDEVFIRNMDAITARLRGEEDIKVDIVFSTDDICAKCPKKRGEGRCEDDGKVLLYDRKVIRHFGLREKSYRYGELVREISTRITAEILEDICGSCRWYPVSACRHKLLAPAGHKPGGEMDKGDCEIAPSEL